MSVETKFEQTMDVQRVVMETYTMQSTSDFEPSPTCRSYRKEHIDGIWTIVQEFLTDQGSPQWNVDGTTSTEPLESNVIFTSVPEPIRNFWFAWKRNTQSPSLAQAVSQSEKAWWDPALDGVKDTAFAAFFKRWTIGMDSYLAPRIILRMNELEDGPPDQSNVGKIEDPIQKMDSKPTIPDGVTFLLTAARGIQEGEKWRNSYEWLGSSSTSGKNAENEQGWDKIVYA